MKTNEKVIRTYEAEDGTVFINKGECEAYELKEAKKIVGESSKYVLGNYNRDSEGKICNGSFRKANAGRRYSELGWTGSLKYATKFPTFEEAYKRAYRRHSLMMTIEAAEEVEEFLKEKRERDEIREQRYVMVFTDERDPVEGGEYITDLGLVHYIIDGKQHFWGSRHTPKFWMQKINKTAR